ncbi:hypothetical protein ABG067_003921 [Albugo candida]
MPPVDIQPVLELIDQLEWASIVEPVLIRLQKSRIKQKIAHISKNNYALQLVENVEKWALDEIIPWIESVMQVVRIEPRKSSWIDHINFSIREVAASSTSSSIQPNTHRSMYKEFVQHHISKLFDIIKEYPHSIAALEDLNICLSNSKEKESLLRDFSEVLNMRLLQPGADTEDILDVYALIIKAFGVFDSQGTMLEAISEPVKNYLRTRKDTIRCIMSKLIAEESDDVDNDLQGEKLSLIQHFDNSDDDEDIDPDEWMPESTQADPTKTTQSRRSDDILQILVNIYGSKEVFVSEYKVLLADRLLQALNYSTEKDLETFELLRLRFQEDGLRDCQVMIRDIEESRRINSNAQSLADNHYQIVDAAILSRFFWPPLMDDSFVMHPKTSHLIENYKKQYHKLKTPRSLQWVPLLGCVELAIELDGVERDLVVSPIEATIMLHFEDKERWLFNELACAMEVEETILRNSMKIWLNLGILRASADRSIITLGASSDESLTEICFSSKDKQSAICTTAQAQQDLQRLTTLR